MKEVRRSGRAYRTDAGRAQGGQGPPERRVSGGTRWKRLALAAPLVASIATSGCAAAVGAALAAGEIRQGIAGMQQLLAFTRTQPSMEIELPPLFTTPLAGTYRGFQVLEDDTVRFFVRTTREPIAPIVDQEGTVTGYALPGIAATSLETLEARVRQRSDLARDRPTGRAIFFVEGVQPPSPGARALYPAAFLGRVAPGESAVADRHSEALSELDIELTAPDPDELSGQTIPHELFGTVAEGVFTLRPDGSAVYRQEHPLEDGRVLVLNFERISETVLP